MRDSLAGPLFFVAAVGLAAGLCATGCCYDDRGCPVGNVLFVLALDEPVTSDARLRASLNGALLAELEPSPTAQCAESPEVVGAELCLYWSGQASGHVTFGSAPGDTTPVDGDVLELDVESAGALVAHHAVSLDYEDQTICAGRTCPPFAFVDLR